MKNPRWSGELIRGLEADKARIKYGCAKALRIVSEERPELLYPHFGVFVRLLGHKNKILQWEAAFVLSQLAQIDADDQFAAIFEKYFFSHLRPGDDHSRECYPGWRLNCPGQTTSGRPDRCGGGEGGAGSLSDSRVPQRRVDRRLERIRHSAGN
jgi:hypothetical protein